MRTLLKVLILLAVMSLAACSAYDPYRYTKTGAVTGAAAGGLLGHQIDRDKGAYLGAAAGALVGGSVGYVMDRQRTAPYSERYGPGYRGDYGYPTPPRRHGYNW